MKKVFFVMACTAGMLMGAQAQVRFGIHANGIGAMGKMSDPEVSVTQKMRLSWKAGLVAEITLADNVSLIPQLNVLSKGGKVKETETYSWEGVEYPVKIEGDYKLTYVELPVNIVYNTKNFRIGAGPSLSYGLGGKTDYRMLSEDGEEIEAGKGKVKFDGDEEANDEHLHLKALEFGVNFLAAWKFDNGLFIQANYNLGLSNISPMENSKWKNSYFGIGVGYFFCEKK